MGDIFDGWRLRKRWYFPQSHANAVRRILTAAKRGTKVYYILGNHDEGLRPFLKYTIASLRLNTYLNTSQIIININLIITQLTNYLLLNVPFVF